MRTKKSLGQHFLTSKKILDDIVRAADLTVDDVVLEIGPGKGILTEALLKSSKKIVAIEKDRELIPVLEEKFKNEIASGKLQLIGDDILKISLPELVEENFKVVANIPYNITGQLLRTLLSGEHQPERMVLMVQKEVAERIIARDGKESLLSISIKVFGVPKYVQTVSKKYFKPQPQVSSAILCIENISRDFFKDIEEEKFFELIKAGFAHKRKLLIRNVESVLGTDSEELFNTCSVDEMIRAEDVPLPKWRCIAQNMP